jgi:hypothetical protein
MIFKIFRPKNIAKKWRFRLKTKLNNAKFWSKHWFLRKTPIFLAKIAENCDHNIDLKHVPNRKSKEKRIVIKMVDSNVGWWYTNITYVCTEYDAFYVVFWWVRFVLIEPRPTEDVILCSGVPKWS